LYKLETCRLTATKTISLQTKLKTVVAAKPVDNITLPKNRQNAKYDAITIQFDPAAFGDIERLLLHPNGTQTQDSMVRNGGTCFLHIMHFVHFPSCIFGTFSLLYFSLIPLSFHKEWVVARHAGSS
jgi:hypothetical protein